MNDIFSKVLKYILATNYYFNIVDEIKETKFYSHKLKNLLNQVEYELDRLQKNEAIKEFQKISDKEKWFNNFDLHNEFFEKLSNMPVQELEEFMINFLKEK